ncbi:MAG: molecular chaperone TorD family protein [Nitrospirota bacterium]
MCSVTGQANNLFLSEIYAQLSELFKEPTQEFADDVASGRLLRFFEDHFLVLGLDLPLIERLSKGGDAYSRLKDEYRRLFLGPMPPYLVPVESVYKKWANDPECSLPLAGAKGYLMGDPAIDMIKRYQAHGIVIPDKYSSMPDHIALELEYMSFLCNNEYEEEQRDFIHSHLDWIDDLKDDIYKTGQSGFYTTAIHITSAFVSFSSHQ